MSTYYVRLFASVHLDRIVEIEANTEEEATEKALYLGYGSLPIDDDILNIDNWRKEYLDPSDIKINRVWKKKE
jgi:hypothetical protein